MFRATISPILRSTRLCLQLWYNAPTMLPTGSIMGALYHSCKHNLVLLRMGEIIARNMLSWLELLINRYCCIHLVVYIILLVMHGHTNTKRGYDLEIINGSTLPKFRNRPYCQPRLYPYLRKYRALAVCISVNHSFNHWEIKGKDRPKDNLATVLN